VSGSQGEGTTARVPDFFIIGHPKCGTTALHAMLKVHPQIYMPDVKEPQFFASDLRVPDPARPHADTMSYDEYLALFANAVAEAQPGARIIALLREPASFVRSLHLQLLQNRSENEPDLRKALALEEQRREGRALTTLAASQPLLLQYTQRARYVEQLRRYHAAFPREQVLVLIYEDFRAENEQTVRTVQRFLGVDDTLPLETVQANETVRRRVGLDDAMFAAAYGEGALAPVKKAIKLATPRSLRRGAFRALQRNAVFGAPEEPDEGFMLELRRRFKSEVQELSEYLDRDLVALWGYESV